MSTLNVANVTDGTTTVSTSYVVNGSAKAWVNFNGTGTVAIRDSLNVSSITDLATGAYSFNFTNNFAAVDYVSLSVGSNVPSNLKDALIDLSTLSTSSAKTEWQTSGVGVADPNYGNNIIIGELA